MAQGARSFIIQNRHRRGKRLWQFFFTGWGLVMVAALAAGALATRQLLFTPISAVNMMDIASNRFRMTNGEFFGTDKDGAPFTIRAAVARQEYDNPDQVRMETVSGSITRTTNGAKIRDDIRARGALYDRAAGTVTLTGNVRVDSSNGDRVRTDELVIKL